MENEVLRFSIYGTWVALALTAGLLFYYITRKPPKVDVQAPEKPAHPIFTPQQLKCEHINLTTKTHYTVGDVRMYRVSLTCSDCGMPFVSMLPGTNLGPDPQMGKNVMAFGIRPMAIKE